MKLIRLKVLEGFMSFKQFGIAIIVFFSKGGHNFLRDIFFIGIDILCKFGENVFTSD